MVRWSYYILSRKLTEDIVAVLAFKQFHNERKRRHNEIALIALYDAMGDMMSVLLWCVMAFNLSYLTDITQPQRCGKRQAHRPGRRDTQ